MKKKILLFTSSIALASLSLMSNNAGPGQVNNNNYTGSNTGTAVGCGQPGCHSGGSYTSQATLTLYDSTGSTIMNTWIPDYPHRVIIAPQTNAPKWGLQVSSSYFNGTIYQGVGAYTDLGTNTQLTTLNNFPIVEHDQALSSTTTQFRWKAPNVTSIDTIKFYLVINNVNGTGSTSGDNSNNFVYSFGRNTASVSSVNVSASVNAYPNPFYNTLNVKLDNVASGNYTLNVTDLKGKQVASETTNINKSYQGGFSTEKWAPGIYHLHIMKDGIPGRVLTVVKY